MSRALLPPLVALLGAAAAACGGGGGGTPAHPDAAVDLGPAGPASAAEGCKLVVAAAAAKNVECLAGLPATGALPLTAPVGDCARLAPLVDAGRVRYDRYAVLRCESALRAVPCGLVAGTAPPWLAPCAAAFAGARGDGQSCESALECASGACDASDAKCPGACQSLGAAGGACDVIAGVRCLAGLACRAGKCGKPALAGDACTDDAECSAGLGCPDMRCRELKVSGACRDASECAPYFRCVGADPTAGTPGACVRPKKSGAACARDDECASFVCDGASCRPLAGVGEACGVMGGKVVGCEGGYCTDLQGSGTCTKRGDAGAPCDAKYFGQDCAEGLHCLAGVCARPTCF